MKALICVDGAKMCVRIVMEGSVYSDRKKNTVHLYYLIIFAVLPSHASVLDSSCAQRTVTFVVLYVADLFSIKL